MRERDFIYFASKMAYEPNLRRDMAHRARERVTQISGAAVAQESWDCVLKRVM
jgi:hypothetical protein